MLGLLGYARKEEPVKDKQLSVVRCQLSAPQELHYIGSSAGSRNKISDEQRTLRSGHAHKPFEYSTASMLDLGRNT